MKSLPLRIAGMVVVIVSIVAFSANPVFGAGTQANRPARPVTAHSVPSQIAYRQAIKFRSDGDYVRALQTAPDAVYVDAVDAVFTPAEAAELLARLELEQDGETLQTFFATRQGFQDAFGGFYIDHEAGGKLVLQLVHNHPRVKDIPALLPPLRHGDRLLISHVAWPTTRLKQEFDRISAVMNEYPGIEAVEINDVTNQVVVTINPVVTGTPMGTTVEKGILPRSFATLLVDPMVIVRSGKVTLKQEAIKAGQIWSNVKGGGGCTLGFEVIDNGNPSMLTAGHCVKNLNPYTTVYQGNTVIGYYSGQGQYQDGTSSPSGIGIDVGVLTMNNAGTATDDIYQGANPSIDVVGAVPNDSYCKGCTRCLRGGYTPETSCGTITLGSTSFQNGSGQYYRDMFTVDLASRPGDSGGPHHRKSTNNNTAEAAGIHGGQVSLQGTNGNDAYASKYYNAASLFNLTLVTTD